MQPGDRAWFVPLPDKQGEVDPSKVRIVVLMSHDFGINGYVWSIHMNAIDTPKKTAMERLLLAEPSDLDSALSAASRRAMTIDPYD